MTLTYLESKAKANATATESGDAQYLALLVRYYPGCKRFSYFDATGPIRKTLADLYVRRQRNK